MPSTKSKPRQKAKAITYQFEATGTQWEIEMTATRPVARKAMAKVHARIEAFSRNYSRFRPDSLVTRMSQRPGVYTLPEDAKTMLDLYYELYGISDGKMTPLIGPTLEEAGYDAVYSLKPKTLHHPPTWDKCLIYEFPRLTIKQPVMLDFGAMGKGYLVDIIAQLLEIEGINGFVINAGGDMVHKGKEPVQVALEHPGNTTQAIGIASLHNQALCGSAGNRRAWAEYNHIIDPVTLKSPQAIVAVWAVADSAMLADALTTALYFTTPETLHKRYNFSYGIVAGDLSLTYSPDFPAEFFA